METKISQQEEVIASHEAQLVKSQSHVAELQRENKKLGVSAEKTQKFQDELDVLKLELEKQTRKANTAEKYVQKLQASQNIEKERDFLRKELEEARSVISANHDLRRENVALQKSNDETSRTLSQIEQDNEELRMTKKQLRLTYDSLAQQVDALNERFAQDQETIADLRDGNGGSQPPTSPAMTNSGLEGELTETSMHENQMQASQTLLQWTRILTVARKTRLAELEKLNRDFLSDATDKDAKVLTLQRQADIAQETSAEKYAQLQRLRQENIALQTSLTQVQQGHPIEGSVDFQPTNILRTHDCQSTEVFKRMRDQVKAADAQNAVQADELSSLRQKLECAYGDRMSSSQNLFMLSDLNIDLLEGSFVDKNQVDFVEDVKRQNAQELTKIRIKYDAAKKQIDLLQAQLDEQTERDQVNHNGSNDPIKEGILRMLKAASPETSIQSKSDAILQKIEDGRERVAKQQEVDHQISSSDAALDCISLSEKESANIEADARPRSIFRRISKKFWHADTV